MNVTFEYRTICISKHPSSIMASTKFNLGPLARFRSHLDPIALVLPVIERLILKHALISSIHQNYPEFDQERKNFK